MLKERFMLNNPHKILVLAPHTDDGELGCGGTIAKFIEEKKQVFYVAFSSAEKSVPKGLPKDILKKEVKKATKILGLSPKNLILFNYEVRNFPKYRQEILEDIIKLNEKIKPDLVLLPSTYDIHQDHQVISQEGFRTFKSMKISILGYELPWNNLTFDTEAFAVLKEKHILKKIRALSCYKSQSGRLYMSGDFIKSLAKTRGVQVGTQYAEAFEVIRLIL
jgi:LmbE family N-acetylglucosaminyl deacetylase